MKTTFKEDIIKEFGLDKLPEDKRMEILLGIGRIIQQNIILRIFEELKEKDKKEFDRFLAKKGDDQEAIFEFLKSKIPNLDMIINEEIENFKSGSIELINNIVK